MGEDVYDLAEQSWCVICQEPHGQCEIADLRYECLTCGKPIEFGDECQCEVDDHCAEHCPLNKGGAAP